MAKAKSKKSSIPDMMPKLVFREVGTPRTEGNYALKEKTVRIRFYSNTTHSQHHFMCLGRIELDKR